MELMRLIDLPKDIRNIAIDRIIDYRGGYYEIPLYYHLTRLFTFNDTIEGISIWYNVFQGNYKPFYDFHKIEDFPRVVMVEVSSGAYKPRVVFKKVGDIYIYWDAENIEDSLNSLITLFTQEKYVTEITDYIEKYGNTK